MIEKFIYLAIVLVMITILNYSTIFLLKKSKKFEDEDIPVFKKSLNLIISIIVLGSTVIIFGIDIENIWATVLSVLAIIAVALFTIWSLLSNIVAGIMIFMSRPFKRKDWIEIHPENMQGRVKEIGVIFVTIEDLDKNLIRVPNNLIFQKYTKVLKKKPSPPEQETVQQEPEQKIGEVKK